MKLKNEICLKCVDYIVDLWSEAGIDEAVVMKEIFLDRVRQKRCALNSTPLGNPTESNFGDWNKEVPRFCFFSAEHAVLQDIMVEEKS